MTRDDLKNALNDGNVQAFLRVLREGETTQTDDAFRWLFGSTKAHPKLFDSFADHPRIRTYEAYDGQFIKNGKIDYTTAAGVGQITETTWNGLVRQYGFPTFEPQEQLLGMIGLIAEKGALDDVKAGRLEVAIDKCRDVWASLPGSPYGQPTIAMERARRVYHEWGGLYQPQATQPAASIEAEQAPAPVEERTQPEPPMSPFAGIALKILGGFVPDIQPILDKAGTPNAKETISNDIIDLLHKVTGTTNSEAAVAKLQAEPKVAETFRAEVVAKKDEWVGMAIRLNEVEEKSRDKARAFAVDYAKGPRNLALEWVTAAAIGIFGLAVLITMGAHAAAVFIKSDPAIVLALSSSAGISQQAAIGAGLMAFGFWLGSSLGSMQKNQPQREPNRKTDTQA